MDFDFWYKRGSLPYTEIDADDIAEYFGDGVITILCESQAEEEELFALQFILGVEFDIRVIGSSSSVNPWVYNRDHLLYTFNPLDHSYGRFGV